VSFTWEAAVIEAEGARVEIRVALGVRRPIARIELVIERSATAFTRSHHELGRDSALAFVRAARRVLLGREVGSP